MGQAITVTLEGLVAGRGGEAFCGPLDLTLRSGEALIVTGENGSGKSTLLRTLAGLVPPLSGAMRIEGARPADGEPARALAEAAHYLGHRNALKGGETLLANLSFWRRHLRGGGTADVVDGALAAFGLGGLERFAVSHLSAGQQRRAALSRLLVAQRPLWILDEPTGALDAAASALFAQVAVRHLAAGGILIAATHMPLGIDGRSLELARAGAGAPS